MEGTILALRKAGFDDIACVQNKTVVTDPFKGENLNRYARFSVNTASPSGSISCPRT